MQKKQILFVDDEVNVLEGLRRLLNKQKSEWDMTFANSADEALRHCLTRDIDVVISDINMPGKSGFDLLKTLRSMGTTQDIPVVILTGCSEKELKRQALELGATDLLNKPAEYEDLLARRQNCLRLKTHLDEIKAHKADLEKKVNDRTKELHDTRLQVIRRLGRAAEFKDNETGMHVIRMSVLSSMLGSMAGMNKKQCDLLLNAAPMHDIGKIGIPDRILLKPGKLNLEEWEIMKTHVTIGAEILSGDDSPLFKLARTVVLYHHEKWDGTGYPLGLKGEEISLEGRVVALCDVFDALTSYRPYKPAWSIEDTMEFIEEQRGRHFDPTLVDHFTAMLPEILDIRKNFPDECNAGSSLDSVSLKGTSKNSFPSHEIGK